MREPRPKQCLDTHALIKFSWIKAHIGWSAIWILNMVCVHFLMSAVYYYYQDGALARSSLTSQALDQESKYNVLYATLVSKDLLFSVVTRPARGLAMLEL